MYKLGIVHLDSRFLM